MRFQTIDGFGTNLAWFYDNPFAATTETRSVFGDETFQDGFFNDLGSSIVRVDLLPFVLTNSGALAPTRADLADPVSLDGTLDENIAKFNFNARGVGHLAPALQAGVDAHGDDFRIIGSIWTPPLWLKADRGGSEPRFVREFDITGGTLDPDQYDAFGNYVVAWIKGYERETGLQFDALSIQNEPRFGDQSFNSNGYSPEGYAEALRVAREAIEQHNLENPDDLITTRLFGTEDVGLGPANLNNPSEVNGFTGAIQDYLEATDSNGVRTLDNLDIQAQHGFVSDRVELTGPRSSAIQWNNFQEYLEANGAGDQPLWQTEYSGEETVWLSRDADGNVLPTQRGALSSAVLIHDALAEGDVSAYVYWQAVSRGEAGDNFSLGGSNGGVSGGNFDTAKASAFRHYSQNIRPDAQRFEVNSDDESILASGYLNDDGSVTYVIINLAQTDDDSLTLTVPESVQGENFDVFQTDEGGFYTTLPDIFASPNGTLSFSVPALSVTTITTLPD